MDVVVGLDILHGCGFVHGDLKTSNIMLQSHSKRTLVAKLLDFSGTTDTTSYNTAGHTSYMTRLWLAPEILLGTQSPYWHKGDTYALGLVLAVEVLLEKGARINAENLLIEAFENLRGTTGGWTAFDWAVRNKLDGAPDRIKAGGSTEIRKWQDTLATLLLLIIERGGKPGGPHRATSSESFRDKRRRDDSREVVYQTSKGKKHIVPEIVLDLSGAMMDSSSSEEEESSKVATRQRLEDAQRFNTLKRAQFASRGALKAEQSVGVFGYVGIN
ncbi:hypothetical protein MMC21_001919 [Puttea exsequens]|nr:hypothetical protein [Puttea exsequens]